MLNMLPTDQRRRSRRQFLKSAAQVSAGAGILGLAAKELAAKEPFDSLPPDVWRHARNNGLVMIRRPAPMLLSWRTQLVSDSEPGQPLIVHGAVAAPDGQTQAAGITVYACNTDAAGYYGENRTEYPPRIYGWMKTDAAGRFELRTVLPGHYPGMHVPAHIHFSLWGAGYPLQWVDELKFAGDRYLTPAMLSQAADQGAFRTIQPLARGEDGTLCSSFRIRLQSWSNVS
jgi:protocatechuate 3,4-dioxygenase beta subunit